MPKKLIENPTIDDFQITHNEQIDYIKWEEIKRVLGYKRYKQFDNFMCGQTCFVDGAYVCDVINFLRPKHKRLWD
jgi:hypothetical protein